MLRNKHQGTLLDTDSILQGDAGGCDHHQMGMGMRLMQCKGGSVMPFEPVQQVLIDEHRQLRRMFAKEPKAVAGRRDVFDLGDHDNEFPPNLPLGSKRLQKRFLAARDRLFLRVTEGFGNVEPVEQRLSFDAKARRRVVQSIAHSPPVPLSFEGRMPVMKVGRLPQELQQRDQREARQR